MRKELQELLYEKYPDIFRNRVLSPQETTMCWGIECGDGWYWLIDRLCGFFIKVYEQTGAEVVADQVKEKFGGLRFYYSGRNVNWETIKRIHKMVWFFETLSYNTCDICGESGSTNTVGWRKARCEKHR